METQGVTLGVLVDKQGVLEPIIDDAPVCGSVSKHDHHIKGRFSVRLEETLLPADLELGRVHVLRQRTVELKRDKRAVK